MFSGFSPATVDFMWNLRFNNEKSWFEAHRDEYVREFLNPMKELALDVYQRVDEKFPNRGFIHKVSRIYRDARRLHGGGPYRDHLWLSIAKAKPAEDLASAPVFWFELSPESWSYGLGYYLARPQTMAKLRARIRQNPRKFEKLIAPLSEQGEFALEGEEYKRPKTAPTPKTAAWFRKKSFSLVHEQPNGEEIFSPELAHRIAAGFAFLMPLYDYFVTLDSDPAPREGT